MAERDRITQFDGLRALAFMAVFLHHGIHAPLLWMGVDLFFVLSGFLITRNLLELRETATPASSLATFYFRRLLRIVPPYYLALGLILIVQPIAMSDASWYFGFASNVRDTVHGPIGGAYNSMWSIAVEEQFYLVWPLLVLFLPRRWLPKLFVAAIAAAPICRYLFTPVGFDAVYRLMPSRMDLLAVGALFAVIERSDARWFERHRIHAIAISCFAVGVFAMLSLRIPTFRTSLDYPLFNVLGFGLSAVLFASILVFVRGTPSGPVHAVLVHPVLRFIGKVSYMAYLVHMLGLDLASHAHLSPLPSALLGLAITLALATVSWYALEQPLQRLRHVVTPKPRTA